MTTELQVKPEDWTHTAAQPAPLGGLRRFLLYGVAPAALSALLLWLCFFPMAIGWFAWIALVPLLCLVRSDLRPRYVYLAAWVGGLLFFWPVLQWMRVADYRMYFTWAMLATYCSVYFPTAVFLIRRIDRRTFVPLVLSVPCVWIGLEFVRSFLISGFAWYFLGHTQHDFLPMIQIADAAGVYGVSFLVAAVNAWLFTVLYQSRWLRTALGLKEGYSDFRIAEQGVIVFLLLAGTVIYGLHRLGQNEFERGPRLALLQGNLDQRLRNEAFAAKDDANPAKDILWHYLRLSGVALNAQQVRPDLIVWPETSYPYQWWEISEKVDLAAVPAESARAARVQSVVRELAVDVMNSGPLEKKSDILLGVNMIYINDDVKYVLYNSALMLRGNGNWGPRYDKIHRIPFGEYVPLDWIPFMKHLMPYDFPYSITPGDHLTRFQLGDSRFGVLICYEDTDPYIARGYGCQHRDGPPVDFLINISNDGWFDGTSEHEEHLAVSRFRAIECRRSLARAVNMGISAVIDPNGRVLKPNTSEEFGSTEEKDEDGKARPQERLHSWFDRNAPVEELPVSEWHTFKKRAGVVAMSVPIDRRTSYYALWGDWLPWTCWGMVSVAMLLTFRRNREMTVAT